MSIPSGIPGPGRTACGAGDIRGDAAKAAAGLWMIPSACPTANHRKGVIDHLGSNSLCLELRTAASLVPSEPARASEPTWSRRGRPASQPPWWCIAWTGDSPHLPSAACPGETGPAVLDVQLLHAGMVTGNPGAGGGSRRRGQVVFVSPRIRSGRGARALSHKAVTDPRRCPSGRSSDSGLGGRSQRSSRARRRSITLHGRFRADDDW